MEVFTTILGKADAPEYKAQVHHLSHAHALDVVRLSRADLSRRRLRVTTEAGAEVAIALPRDLQLYDGALLALAPDRALIVRVETETWLRLAAVDQAAALRLGYFCGNFHWRVRFEGAHLLIAIETDLETYLARLEPMLATRDVIRVPDPEHPA